MKKVILVLLCFVFFNVNAQTNKKLVDSVQIKEIKISIDSLNKKVAILEGKQITKPADCCKQKQLGCIQNLLVFTPIMFFILMIVLVYFTVGKKFKIYEALTENDFETKTKANAEYKTQNITAIAATQAAGQLATLLPPTITISEDSKSKSSSRYLALLTGFTTLILIVCMMSFYIYSYLQCPENPIDFGKLTTPMLALFIGIAPYIFNKVSDALKTKQ